MAWDYSRFSGIGDSDSGSDAPAGDGPQDLQSLVQAYVQDQGGEGPPSFEAPSKQRKMERDENAKEDLVDASAEGLERCIELLTGDSDASKGEDISELVAAAKAIMESSISAGKFEAPAQLTRALKVGLGQRGDAADVARQQAPEFVPELLALSALAVAGDGSSSASSQQITDLASESEEVLQLSIQHCKAQELYTFVMEAFYSEDLTWAAKNRAVKLLQDTILKMKPEKRHLFLGSCLPVVLKRLVCQDFARGGKSQECLIERLEAVLDLALALSPSGACPEGGVDDIQAMQVKTTKSMVSAFLLKVLQRALPVVLPAAGLDAVEEVNTGDTDSTTRRGRSPQCSDVKLRLCEDLDSAVEILCKLASAAAAASPRPMLSLLEEIDLGDPEGDGGGDLEISALSLASLVSIAELPGGAGHRRLMPQVLPLCLSPARRANVLMRSCFILVSNCDAAAPGVVSLGDLSGAVPDDPSAATATGRQSPGYSQRGLALFVQSAMPMLQLAAQQSPQAYASLSSSLCRWHPGRIFRKLLEALASTPDVEQGARGAAFRSVATAMKIFHWPARCQLYLDIISASRVDSIIGAVVTLFKDDWWPRIISQASQPSSLVEERSQLVNVLSSTLSGEVQIIDGMDTLTAALNIARLVALAKTPAAAFLRDGLRRNGTGSMDLEAKLSNISKQIDAELGILEHGDTSGLSHELAEAMSAALGRDGASLAQMKRDRITMVAHLVSRVREVMAESNA